MKTLEELQKMNDQQLTFELACLVFGEDECYMSRCLQVAECTSGSAKYVDLSDWSWIMPLAVEHDVNLSLLPLTKKYTAFDAYDKADCYSIDESLQRAIAQCLVLKLQGEEK